GPGTELIALLRGGGRVALNDPEALEIAAAELIAEAGHEGLALELRADGGGPAQVQRLHRADEPERRAPEQPLIRAAGAEQRLGKARRLHQERLRDLPGRLEPALHHRHAVRGADRDDLHVRRVPVRPELRRVAEARTQP